MNEELAVLFQRIEKLGWTVTAEGENIYYLSKFSPAGQDFNIQIEGENEEEIIDSIDNAHENYDVSYETYLWLDSSGHGSNGAPYELRDVLEDMEACEQYILELYNELT